LFISHDMWNVRRLCSQILWIDEGRVRAVGPAGAIAERYMSEVNLQALANEGTALQSHRGGTGEVRFERVDLFDDRGMPVQVITSGATLVVRGSYRVAHPVRRPVFQLAIVDVDSGMVVSTAGSDAAHTDAAITDGMVEWRFPCLPLRPRHYVLRLSILDHLQLAAYDVVSAGPRFAVIEQGRGIDSLADEQDGLVTLPFDFVCHPQAASRV
jgi:hypothetical protein